MPNKVPVSILVPVRNEANNLKRCLDSVSWADEIVVVDSQSTDGTQEIAASAGATVVQFKFNGVWPKKKNWTLDNYSWKHEWVFILDADEVLPPDAEKEFASIVTTPGEFAGYLINRRFFFMNKWLRHAYFPNWNLRLFRHALGRYEKLTDSATGSGDNEVHEHVILKGPVGKLNCLMDHYAFPNVETFVEKHNRYSSWEAKVALDKYLAPSQDLHDVPELGARRRLKQIYQKLPCRPLVRFLYIYFVERGFLDGAEGFYFATLHGFYEFMTQAKIAELKSELKSRHSEPI
jgi:glycosyltransferase involved in cell wall biosynthesis